MVQVKKNEVKNQVSIITFQIGWEQFVIDLLDIKEIIQAGQVRKLPKSMGFIDGIYNYRGEIIHIINLKKKLNLDEYMLYQSKYSSIEEDSTTTKKFIIIIKTDNALIGFYADNIVSIDHIDPNEIVSLSPIFQTSVAFEYIRGIINFEDRPRVMLDLTKIFTDVEKYRVQEDLSSIT